MGYYVRTTNCDFCIKKENLKEAYDAVCRLNWQNEKKNGGRWSDERPDPIPSGPNKWTWFSWMPWNYHEICKNLEQVLKALGFEVTTDEKTGDIVDLYYGNKSGDEEIFFNALAPYILDGSTIDWTGEEGEHWRWLFVNGKKHELLGQIEYR